MKKAQPGLRANRGSRLIPWVSWITMGLSAAVGALFLWVDATGAKPPTHALAAVSLLGIAASILTIVVTAGDPGVSPHSRWASQLSTYWYP